jgi:putative addiction module antidote
MMILKLRPVGTSTGLILPEELLAQLELQEGDEVIATPAREGIMLTKADAEVAEEVGLGREMMKRYPNTLHELAK